MFGLHAIENRLSDSVLLWAVHPPNCLSNSSPPQFRPVPCDISLRRETLSVFDAPASRPLPGCVVLTGRQHTRNGGRYGRDNRIIVWQDNRLAGLQQSQILPLPSDRGGGLVPGGGGGRAGVQHSAIRGGHPNGPAGLGTEWQRRKPRQAQLFSGIEGCGQPHLDGGGTSTANGGSQTSPALPWCCSPKQRLLIEDLAQRNNVETAMSVAKRRCSAAFCPRSLILPLTGSCVILFDLLCCLLCYREMTVRFCLPAPLL